MCDIVIYKKYIHIYLVTQMTNIHFSHKSGPHPQFPAAHSSQNLWNFLSDKSNGKIFDFLSSVPENASGSEG